MIKSVEIDASFSSKSNPLRKEKLTCHNGQDFRIRETKQNSQFSVTGRLQQRLTFTLPVHNVTRKQCNINYRHATKSYFLVLL